MSEEIKITIVIDDEKLDTESKEFLGRSKIVTHDLSTTLMSTLLKNDLIGGSFCGGRGDCGRCRVQFLRGATTPTPLERSVLAPKELRQGYRLACLTKPKDDCVIRLALIPSPKIDVITDMIAVTENDDQNSQQKKRIEKSKPHVTQSMEVVIAVDLGTTTIAMQLMEFTSGRIMDSYCELNPQRRYGADVLSRVQASCNGNRAVLQQIVVEVLERGVAQFMEYLGRRAGKADRDRSATLPHAGVEEKAAQIKAMCIAGNTTMEHLLMGHDVSSLGRSPFTPVEIGLQEFTHPAWQFPVWLVPGISAFVGGDIVAGLYALGMLRVDRRADARIEEQAMAECERADHANAAYEETDCGNEAHEETDCGNEAHEETDCGNADHEYADLLIDLGTNGELAITDGSRMIVTATAAGPAFEGGVGAGIVGSDMIACAASLLQQGILDETGLLAEPYFTEGVTVGEPPIRLCHRDIRDLQMAKAAVRAGVEILWWQMGEPKIGHVWLAGGFGYYLDVEAAFTIGLLPEHMRGSVRAAGNTSLAGAYQIARDLLWHRIDRKGLEQSLTSVVSMNLAAQEEFQELYVRYMDFL